MLNLDETLDTGISYNEIGDFFLKFVSYSVCVIVFIESLRSQISEINLLQLIPGFYLLLLFISLILLLFVSDFLFYTPLKIDSRKELGTKTLGKISILVTSKFSLFLLLSNFCIIINTIIPLSLDSFNSYGEKTLENIWSFDEVLNLEITLLIILLVLSQVPLFLLLFFTNEKQLLFLQEYWKIISLVIVVSSGFLTPTIDGYTQLSFSFSTLFLYVLSIIFLERKLSIKFIGSNLLE